MRCHASPCHSTLSHPIPSHPIQPHPAPSQPTLGHFSSQHPISHFILHHSQPTPLVTLRLSSQPTTPTLAAGAMTAVADLPGYIICAFAINSPRVGRRLALVSSFFIGGICLIAIGVIRWLMSPHHTNPSLSTPPPFHAIPHRVASSSPTSPHLTTPHANHTTPHRTSLYPTSPHLTAPCCTSPQYATPPHHTAHHPTPPPILC